MAWASIDRRSLLALAGGLTLGGPAAAVKMPAGKYLEAPGSPVAVILAHGQGLDADSQVVSPLRKGIHRELGFHTLSLQMPVLPGRITQEHFLAYAETFPDAYARIQAAIDFLRQDKGVQRIYLMGYSMGARMATAFLAEHPQAGIAGFIGVGITAGGPDPLNSNRNLMRVRLPVLDVYAEDDMDAQFAANRRRFMAGHMEQVPIPGARHDYRGHEDEVLRAVVDWLKRQEAR
ncbi:MAG TPA: alpha/beta fold hydrolase [Rubrivivax sp.]|nr:alpha/beta fold hydrolase [Rubrivivax sp.]HPO18686.1 alpha/beta fold hydrolase [Rubrivivax sp.]